LETFVSVVTERIYAPDLLYKLCGFAFFVYKTNIILSKVLFLRENKFSKETVVWPRGWSVRLLVGRPGFDFLVESDQKTLKIRYSQLPCLTFSINGVV